MPNIRTITRTAYISIATLLTISLLPVTSWADNSSNTCSPPPSTQPGVHWPTGSDAGTFTYQCTGSDAGEWTNQYYVFDPSTLIRTPLYSPDYSYDCAAGVWYMTVYDYSAATGQYSADRVTTTDPGIPNGCPVPTPVTPITSSDPTSISGNSPVTSNSNTGPGSNNSISNNGNNNVGINNTTNATLSNTIAGTASSGDTLVMGNTSAGNAGSGNVLDQANIVNMLQSSSNVLGSGNQIMTFTANINGDVNGNLLIDPAALSNVQGSGPNSNNSTNTNLNNNVTVNNSTGLAINNNINLAANSGNAAVSNNTSAGNAASGTAETVTNVVNAINSAISAGKSFIGTININGNLNGNILLPPNLIDQLLAANTPTVTITGPGSTNSANTNVNNNVAVNNTNNLGINNNISTNATSGSANVSNNTSGGSASSGNAANHLTAFNLTGSNIIGANDLLVFVNVTGKWVGLIINAPAGTTAAEFGGGVTNSGPNSNNTSNTNVNNNVAVNNTVNEQINNNIAAAANSGNASVSNNTKGGNATTGNADNAINLLNMENSSINLTGWFGILFINVFGTWDGNFGVSPTSTNNSAAASNSSPASDFAVFRFQPQSTSAGAGGKTHDKSFGINPLFSAVIGSNNGQGGNSNTISAVLASVNTHKAGLFAPKTSTSGSHGNVGKTAVIIGSAVTLYIIGDAMFTNRATIRKTLESKLR